MIRLAIMVALGAGGLGFIYLKGRSDASSAIELKALKAQQAAVEKSINIRRNARLPSADSRLLDSDGFRRD
jgi:hypothetical protein